jgi:hypothetical protein
MDRRMLTHPPVHSLFLRARDFPPDLQDQLPSPEAEALPQPAASVTLPALGRRVGMESDDPTARVRARRRRALIDELLPKVRRLNPHWSDHQVLEMAESMAEVRLLDEELG